VVIARICGSLVGGCLAVLVISQMGTQPIVQSNGQTMNVVDPRVGLFVPVIVGAVVTGIVTHYLLPRMSGKTISVFNATVAAAAGGLVALIAVLAVDRTVILSGPSTAAVFFGAGSLFVGVLTYLAGVAITSGMVAVASKSDSDAPARTS
jgi:hypothetical protein